MSRCQPLDKSLAPVRRYCEWMKREFNRDFVVLELPIKARLREQGFRYVSVPAEERAEYINGGALEVERTK